MREHGDGGGIVGGTSARERLGLRRLPVRNRAPRAGGKWQWWHRGLLAVRSRGHRGPDTQRQKKDDSRTKDGLPHVPDLDYRRSRMRGESGEGKLEVES